LRRGGVIGESLKGAAVRQKIAAAGSGGGFVSDKLRPMVALTFFCVAVGLWNTSSPGEIREFGGVLRDVVFVEEIVCGGPAETAELRDVEIRFATPVETVGQTFLAAPTIRGPVATALADPHRNRVYSSKARRLAPGEALRVEWSVRVRLQERVYVVDRASTPKFGRTPLEIAAAYLGDGGKHSLADPALRAEAEAARRSAVDAYDLARKLNVAVRERLTYDRDGRWDDAATSWRTGRGSCSEYHFVFSTLCRLAGLPCRYVGATAWRGGSAKEAVDVVYHRWSEVWLPGFGWFPVDVSRNDGEDGAAVDRAFGRIGAGLLVVTRADGGEDDPLGAAYLATSTARRVGGAVVERTRRAVWTAVEPTTDDDAPPPTGR
jgi:transglutaminase-like putative cysteine protease